MRKNFGSNPWFYPLPVLIIGQIVNVSADESVLGADGRVDAAKVQAISFDPCGNTYVKMGETVGSAFQDGKKLQ